MLKLKRYPGESVILTAENLYLKIIFIGWETITAPGDNRHLPHKTTIQKFEFWNENCKLWFISGKDICLDFYYKEKHIKCYMVWNQVGYASLVFEAEGVDIRREEIYLEKQANALSVKG